MQIKLDKVAENWFRGLKPETQDTFLNAQIDFCNSFAAEISIAYSQGMFETGANLEKALAYNKAELEAFQTLLGV